MWDKKQSREFLQIAGMSFFLVAILSVRTSLMTYGHPNFAILRDHHKYIYMAAGNLFDFHIAPFCWRVAVPWLAGIMPFDLQWNFFIIAFVSIWMTGTAVYYLAVAANFPRDLAVMGMFMFFSLGWATRFVLYDFWLADPASFLIVTLAVYCLLTKKDFLFAIILAIGVTVKETVIFTAPLYYTLNKNKPVDPVAAKRAIILALPAAAILLAIRKIIPQMNGDLNYLRTLPAAVQSAHLKTVSSYNYWAVFKQISAIRFHTLNIFTPYFLSFGTFGVILLLPFFSLRQNALLFLKFLPFFILVYSQLLFAVDTMRLLVLAFPVIIIMALNGVAAIAEILRLRPKHFIVLPLLLYMANLIHVNYVATPMLYQMSIFTAYLALTYIVSRKTRRLKCENINF